jgi:hypothetical protein
MPCGLRQIALSISCLSPIVRRPDAVAVTKIASLILLPERRFLAVTSFQSRRRPSLSFGSSSLISLRRQSLSVSRARLRPPGNIQSPSRFRLTRSTRPRFTATSFEDFAIAYDHHLSNHRSFDLGGLFHFKAAGIAADRAASVTLIGTAWHHRRCGAPRREVEMGRWRDQLLACGITGAIKAVSDHPHCAILLTCAPDAKVLSSPDRRPDGSGPSRKSRRHWMCTAWARSHYRNISSMPGTS